MFVLNEWKQFIENHPDKDAIIKENRKSFQENKSSIIDGINDLVK